MFSRLKVPVIVLVFLSAAGLSFFFGYSKTAQPKDSSGNGDLNSSGLGLGTTGGFSQTQSASNSQGLTGEIICIEEGGNAEASPDLCTKGLFVANPEDTARGGTSYELVDSGGAGLDNFSKGERVIIFGTIKAGSSSLGLDATIDVTGVKRVQ